MIGKIKDTIESQLGESIADVSGSRITTVSGRECFLKTGRPSQAFRCEADGLAELATAGTLNIVKPLAVGDNFIVTEYTGRGTPSPGFFENFGRDLARMHRYTATQFGFYEDNFIGANPQENIASGEEKHDWPAFYFNKRLLFQYRLAERNGYATASLSEGFRRMESRIGVLLEGSAEQPCLLHGDLWSGNYMCGSDGEAVLIDPAVYYGHREADLAMTKLFGGFPPAFYRAYQREYPLKEGWERREGLYRLYHVMNHLNLFGRSYLAEAEHIISQYTK